MKRAGDKRAGAPARVIVSVLAAGLAGVLAGGCAATSLVRTPVPEPLVAEATLPDLPGVRAWADIVPKDMAELIRERMPNMPRLAQNAETVNGRPVIEILALSGGGPDGAFGAGLLAGWTAQGTRPEFEVVTGVSAGAIIAPFAFLGPRYDPQLKEIWTQYSTNEIALAQILPGLLGGASLADTGPLEALIDRYVTSELLDEVAAEYRKGRLLMVLTTNLDAQRPVVWNMGEIAASRHARARELFKKVILASAAIPGAFPPVPIEVRAKGKTYEELHVDGGTTREVFTSPAPVPFHIIDRAYSKKPIRKLYIVKNGKLAPEYKPVTPRTLSIAGRAISTLILNQSAGEIYRIWRNAKDGGADFNLIAVPDDFTARPDQAFDPVYQSKLFDAGFALGNGPTPWLKSPPDVDGSRVRLGGN